MPASSELDPLLTSQDHRQLSCCYKLSYKPRKFSSKGAVLVLLWQFLVVSGLLSVETPQPQLKFTENVPVATILVIVVILVAIISGWLADTTVGRCKVVQTGLFLTWLGLVSLTVTYIVVLTVDTSSSLVIGTIQAIQYISIWTNYCGAAIFITNIIQFGLEQMPDASSDAMTAFISWVVAVTFLGEGGYDTVNSLLFCISLVRKDDHILKAIAGSTLLSIAMCSKFLFSHWLINHRQNHNPLKTVYRVLKFAKQHKYPVNRSAFTYCEDEIPSRIDLGKSKYGGPFTTEEVEDVKTFFRILVMLPVILVFTIAVFLQTSIVSFHSSKKNCLATSIINLKGFFTAAVCLTYEYLIDPLIKTRYRLSMLKKIGFCMLYGVLSSVILFVYTVVTEVDLVDLPIISSKTHHSIGIIFDWLTHIIVFIGLCSFLQFIYSQAPEQMKGLFSSCTWLMGAFVMLTTNKHLIHCSINKYCGVYLTSVAVSVSVLMIIVYCCLARRYKRRERDEPCNERARIEEIYGRRVEHNSVEENDSD